MKLKCLVLAVLVVGLFGCAEGGCMKEKKTKTEEMGVFGEADLRSVVEEVMLAHEGADRVMVERGVRNAAGFWMASDGEFEEFKSFCIDNYVADSAERHALYMVFDRNLALMNGRYNQISLGLKRPLHVRGLGVTKVDEVFGGMDPFAHFSDDMFGSKLAFHVLLNFPFYSLEEKNAHSDAWSREEWAYARLGDLFSSRVPSVLSQELSRVSTIADNYISNYNIMMDKLRTDRGEQLFADGMMLISHWGLRDELKSNYSNVDGRGLEKQRMIYKVMERIVDQSIPSQVISNGDYEWEPYGNVITKEGDVEEVVSEPNTRYEMLHSLVGVNMAMDSYCPTYGTYIERSFDQQMQVGVDEIEAMFKAFISSEEVKIVGEMIEKRLGRDLEPFDIWYDGFKVRSGLDEDELSAELRKRYPTADAFKGDLPNLMVKLGFTREKADAVCERIRVDASTGAGHAWPGMSKDDYTYLRSRIGDNGLDYKGYNIGVHEFGHNVEQVISMGDVDYYTMSSVPSTAFTEALAFVFQSRDLMLMGREVANGDAKHLSVLDMMWGCYEIMGVSLVDIYTWKWLYGKGGSVTVEELKEKIRENAREVWNDYYAPVLGHEDSEILAIYSHMIDIPLYLPNYPYGSIVESQFESQVEGKVLADEICRIYKHGKLTPNAWMRMAAGEDVSIMPLLKKTREAVEALK